MSCIDIYKGRDTLGGTYFPRIKSITFDKIAGDTLIYLIVTVDKYCLSDTLLLSNGNLLSKDNYLNSCLQYQQ